MWKYPIKYSKNRYLGAAKTSAFYAINPFIGSLLSFVLLKEAINYSFFYSFDIYDLRRVFCK